MSRPSPDRRAGEVAEKSAKNTSEARPTADAGTALSATERAFVRVVFGRTEGGGGANRSDPLASTCRDKMAPSARRAGVVVVSAAVTDGPTGDALEVPGCPDADEHTIVA